MLKEVFNTGLAILCITALLIVAMAKGIDGIALAGGCALIAGLGGYTVKALRDKIKANHQPKSGDS